jgi:hypothetical protein
VIAASVAVSARRGDGDGEYKGGGEQRRDGSVRSAHGSAP